MATTLRWSICFAILLSSCQEDPRFNVRLYNGRFKEIAVVRSVDGDTVYCTEPRFDTMTCAYTEELTREVRRLQRCCQDAFSDSPGAKCGN